MPVKTYVKVGNKAKGYGGIGDFNLDPTGTVAAIVAGAKTVIYDPPSTNVIYVSPTGSDSNSGLTEAAPKKTLDAAYAACSTDWTIVLRAGIYRDRFSSNLAKKITIQGYGSSALGASEMPIICGSDVFSVWTDNGNGTWTTSYAPTFTRFSTTGYSGTGAYRNYIDQVFRDNIALTQIGDGETPAPGQFSVNQTADTLTIADDPVGHLVEATTRNFLAPAMTQPVTMRNLTIRRFSPTFIDGSTNGMLYIAGSATGYVFENVIFKESAISGLSIARSGTIRNCTFEDMGASGVNATTANGMVFQRNVVRRCNRQLWQMQPVTGGFKVTRSRDLIIENNWIEDVWQAAGIWLDVSCLGAIIRHNRLIGPLSSYVSKSNGIVIELSDGGYYGSVQHKTYVVGNTASGFEVGISNYDSGWVVYANNDVRKNRYSMYVWQDNRWNDGYDVVDTAATPTEAPWYANHQAFYNNMSSQHDTLSSIQVLVYDKGAHNATRTSLPAPPVMLGLEMIDYFGGHWFAPAPPGTAIQLGRGADVRNSYNTQTALSQAGSDVGGPWASGQLGQVSFSSSSPGDSIATPLPADVALAGGVATGTAKLGPLLPSPVPSY